MLIFPGQKVIQLWLSDLSFRQQCNPNDTIQYVIVFSGSWMWYEKGLLFQVRQAIKNDSILACKYGTCNFWWYSKNHKWWCWQTQKTSSHTQKERGVDKGKVREEYRREEVRDKEKGWIREEKLKMDKGELMLGLK